MLFPRVRVPAVSFEELVRRRHFKLLETSLDQVELPEFALHELLVVPSPPVTLITRIIQEKKSFALKVDLLGRSPLYLAIVHRCDLNIVMKLLDAIETTDLYGRTPLHLAVLVHSKCPSPESLNLINALFHSHPPALLARDVWGQTPLDLVANSRSNTKLIQQFLEFKRNNTEATEDTETTSLFDLYPFEIQVTTSSDDDDASSCSSIGTGGVSTFRYSPNRVGHLSRKASYRQCEL